VGPNGELVFEPTPVGVTSTIEQFVKDTANALTPGHRFTWYVGAVSTNNAAMMFQTTPA
jgi:hypothetical protein